MTKLLCTLGILLLSCGVAEAQQDIYTDCTHKAPDGTTYDICRLHELRWYADPVTGLNVVSKCELKMKEAMKLISPYIDYGDTVSTTDALYRSPQQKLREEADRMDKRDAAIRKWNTIYQECVK